MTSSQLLWWVFTACLRRTVLDLCLQSRSSKDDTSVSNFLVFFLLKEVLIPDSTMLMKNSNFFFHNAILA